MQKDKKILFLTLKIFSATGGIEKVCKVAGKALYELEGENVSIYSIYDKRIDADTKYFPRSIFKGFSANKIKAAYCSIIEGTKSKIVIISHINLLPIAFAIKKISPKTKLVLLAHGIEVWQPLTKLKLKMLHAVDLTLAVSNYTKDRMNRLYNIDNIKCQVLNNCLDPFLPETVNDDEVSGLYKKYHLNESDFIMITVTRIAADEKYKGHDKVLESMHQVINEFPNLRYVIVGKYDLSEKNRLDHLIEEYNLKNNVIFTGFIPDNELAAHYKLADVFIMPSSGEGFGIVFIEAMYYGLSVIAGNKDGSQDALSNGQLGVLVDPSNAKEISSAVKNVIMARSSVIPDKALLMHKFSYAAYKHNLKSMLMHLN